MDFSFSGAGFMGCYYFGVVDCLSKYIPRERINRVSGTSAGSLSAAYFLLNLPLSNCLREIIELTESVRKRPLGVFDRSNQIVDLLPKLLDRIFPEDAHKKVSGKLFVCMTRMKDMKKVLVSEFDSKKDLIDALNCSCYIPVWSGNRTPCYKGVKHIDGGFSDGLPAFDEHTIRICCFSGPSDISPYDKVRAELLQLNIIGMPLNINLANLRRARKALWPPTISNILQMLESGYHDTKDFILTNDLIQCDDCYGKTDLRDSLLHERTINLTLTPNASPVVSRSGSFNQFSPARRKTIQAENSLLVVPDRFVQYQNPSCPPSPNLNRHCGECLKMRQEARLDQVDENLMAEAEKWRNEEGSRNKSVSSPFRWVNILRRKTLYKL